ncbi:MAG TPA: hypothetical protein VGO37_20595 [Steroidobacteraceae bacterium]|jgi:hypothetical protein|nr:hypothetical protein [Steroidobacteraceae bacterium]
MKPITAKPPEPAYNHVIFHWPASPMTHSARCSPSSDACWAIKAAPQLRIFIIDKSEDSACALATLLVLIGHASEFEVSLDHTHVCRCSFSPDVILVGLGLIDVKLIARLQSKFDGVKVVGMIGSRYSDEKQTVLAAGCDGCLYYLAEPEEWQQQLNNVLSPLSVARPP